MNILRKGKVFTTYWTENSKKEKVVLKLINYEYFSDSKKYQKILKQFQIEKNILKLLDFDFIPKYISSTESCLCMSYIEGENLKDIKNKLTYKEKLDILIQLSQIVKKLHNAKIIHCDIKPENIIYNKGKVYLIDFGSAMLDGEKVGYIQGSKIYSAPEIYIEFVRCPQNDIYSIASMYNQLIEEEKKDYRIIYGGMKKNKRERFNNIDKILKILFEIRRKI